MAKRNSNSNQLHVFEAKLINSQLVGLKSPPGITFSKDTYSTKYYGKTFWNGEFKEGDLVVIDPELIPIAGDYVVIWVKGESNPFVEKMAMSFMPDTIGKDIHPDSNAIPSFSILLQNGFMRMVPCSKLEKVHKIIGKINAPNDNVV